MRPEQALVSHSGIPAPATRSGVFDEYRKIPAAAWRRSEGAAQLPRRGDRLWLRVHLRNSGDVVQRVIVRYETPWTDRVLMAALDDSGAPTRVTEGGDASANAGRMERPFLELDLAPGAIIPILVRLENPRRVSVDLKLYTPESYRQTAFREWILQGLLFGGGFMLLAFHVSIYLAIRDRLLARYIAYLAFAGTYLFLRSGLLARFLSDDWTAYGNAISSAAVAGLYYAGIRFAREFLQLGGLWPRVDAAFHWIQRLALALIPLYVWDRFLAIALEDLMGILAGAPLLAVGALSARRNWRRSAYFLAGWSLPVLAALLESLRAERIIGDFAHSAAVLPTAMLLEFFLFGGVLRNRLARIREERIADGLRMARIEQDLDFARRIQRDLLPAPERAAGALRFQAAYESAQAVGGGYYDFWQAEPGAVGVLIAGAQGAGLPAALDASMVRLAFRTASVEFNSPSATLEKMSQFLQSQLAGRTVRAAYAVADAESGVVRVASAGIGAIFLYRAGTAILSRLLVAGAPLGTPSAEARRVEEVRLAPGDALALFSDGFLRAGSDEALAYNLEQACAQALQSVGAGDGDACAALLARVRELNLPGGHDLTFAVLRRAVETGAAA